jgi:hypothetical protein
MEAKHAKRKQRSAVASLHDTCCAISKLSPRRRCCVRRLLLGLRPDQRSSLA